MSGPAKHTRSPGFPAAVGLLFYLGLLMYWFSGAPINHDSSWFLHATAEWLRGARLYQDIMEVNPPLIFLHHVPAVLLSDVLGITRTQAFYATILALIFASLWWSGQIVARTHGRRTALVFLAGSALALVFPFSIYFGQREHFLVIFLWPYLAAHLTEGRPDAGWRAVTRALFAAFGVLLKPYFILIPLTVTFGRLLSERDPRAVLSCGNLTFGVAGVVYVLAAWLLLPAYFESIVPLAVATYDAYRLTPVELASASQPWLVIPLFAVSAAAWRAGLPRGLPYALLAATGALGAYLAQGNGFDYHAIPLFALLCLYYTWLAAAAPGGPTLALGLAALALQAQFTFRAHPYSYAMEEVFAPYMSGPDRARSIVAVSPDIMPYFPLVDLYGTEWEGRFPVQWPVVGPLLELARTDCATAPDRCAELNDRIAGTVDLVAQDIRDKKPDLVVFDSRSPFFWPLDSDRRYDLQKRYFAEPSFAAAMADYRFVGEAENHRFWRRIVPLP
ncbi:hypothetical protein OU426_15635 [Frigidibacter sp. RF13]|uniref:hypothetical protein n=1 Tax=Frigidibacter sp. RF13 TaxID=2997340 RepID=UPI00226DAA48|nr:hypothetical protein [Frigidibacter sp. RF13]MCY1128296.1 hypothetical protein [Frigidibacter sp. RF13]